MASAATLILKAGQKLEALADHPGDFEDWIVVGLGEGAGEVQTLDVRTTPPLPSPETYARVLVTGSAAMVSDREPWAEATAAWLRDAVAADTPVLGICFGHQLLAHALGGEAGWNTNGVEVGSVAIELTPEASDDRLLGGLPTRFMANMSHRQSVLALPNGAVRLAHSALDPNAAFRYGHKAWGVQFHPEFDATTTRAHIDWYRPALAERGADAETLLAEVNETPYSHGVLARFAAIS